jgi:hypothetical protein
VISTEEKKERRRLSHELQVLCYKKINRVVGIWQTPRQVASGARLLRDRIVAAGRQDAKLRGDAQVG